MENDSKASDAAAVVWKQKPQRKQLRRRNSFSCNIRQIMLNTPNSRLRIVHGIA